MAMNTLEHSFFHKTNISMIFRVNTKKKTGLIHVQCWQNSLCGCGNRWNLVHIKSVALQPKQMEGTFTLKLKSIEKLKTCMPNTSYAVMLYILWTFFSSGNEPISYIVSQHMNVDNMDGEILGG